MGAAARLGRLPEAESSSLHPAGDVQVLPLPLAPFTPLIWLVSGPLAARHCDSEPHCGVIGPDSGYLPGAVAA